MAHSAYLLLQRQRAHSQHLGHFFGNLNLKQKQKNGKVPDRYLGQVPCRSFVAKIPVPRRGHPGMRSLQLSLSWPGFCLRSLVSTPTVSISTADSVFPPRLCRPFSFLCSHGETFSPGRSDFLPEVFHLLVPSGRKRPWDWP